MRNDQPRQRRLPSADDGVCRSCGGDTQGGFVPCICRYHKPVKFESGAWFLRQVQRAVSLMPWSLSTDKLEQIEEECEGRESPGPSDGRELRNVREFLETLSAQLAGGTLEGTRIAPLYEHPAYESMFERHHAALRDTLASLARALRDALTRKLEGASVACCVSHLCPLEAHCKLLVDESMFERHHAALRDTLASLARAFRDALTRKLEGASVTCCVSHLCPLEAHCKLLVDESMFERHHAAPRDTLASLARALRDALTRKLEGASVACCVSHLCPLEAHCKLLVDESIF
ncbi:hypothetical protein ABMA28_007379 [Loxostege sticticalis]|uniref:Uncharacterized protein n=1 Tax=Loxostege sticticalis TaxID=481309 RepID=A0ABD0TQK2_LOXSC